MQERSLLFEAQSCSRFPCAGGYRRAWGKVAVGKADPLELTRSS
jgi:hypothetical protein